MVSQRTRSGGTAATEAHANVASQDVLEAVLVTKLHRPAPPPDAILRPHLVERLERGCSLPMTLVSAPAGYGKTTLVSQWLDHSARPSAWLQLDKHDEDMGVFLTHLVAAVRSVQPEALAETASLAAAPNIAPLPILAHAVGNDLAALSQPLILVLDDYGALESEPLDELLATTLDHPPPPVHLVLISRRDPQLPLGRMRGRGSISELRAHDLRLERAETEAFITVATGHEPDQATTEALEERTEGWISGLRLAVHATRATGSDLKTVAGIGPLDGATRDYLLAEVLEAQPAAIRELMMASAVPERFSAGLCEALIEVEARPPMDHTSGQDFIDWVVRNGCFVVQLDVEGTWYRYHHLFQDLLRRRWQQAHDAAELIELQRRAGAWFAAEGSVEEALGHLLAAGEVDAAATLVAEHGKDASDRDEWQRIGRWLDRLPREVVRGDARLLVLEAWQRQAGAVDPDGVRADLRDAAALFDAGRVEPGAVAEVQGSLETLRAYAALVAGEASLAEKVARRALELLPPRPVRPAAFAKMIEVMALQGGGDVGGAVACAVQAMADDRFGGGKHVPWPFALSYVWLLEADRRALLRHGRDLRDLGVREGYPDARHHGGYFMGAACYLGDDLAGAQAHFEPIVADRFSGRPLVCLHAAIGLAFTLQTQGHDDDAAATAELAVDYVLAFPSPQLQRFAAAFGAAFAVREGRVAEAARWARGYEPGPPLLEFHLFSPALAHIEVLLAAGTKADVERAVELLDAYQAFAGRTHNRLHLIKTLSLRALADAARSDTVGALSALGRAVTLSQPGDVVRAVADRGPGVVPLLNRLEVEGEELAHVGAILSAVAEPDAASGADAGLVGVADPRGLPALTPRELEVLALLERRYSNKEIAQELIVAPETVKKYTISLYEKLNVKGRHEAAAKGRALGYLRDTEPG